MYSKPLESDWKLFSKRAPEWRECYLHQKNNEVLKILTNPDRTPTEQFWDTKEVMDKEARILMDCLDGHSRSKMKWFLMMMLRYGLISKADLQEFSTELQDELRTYME